MKHIFGLSTRDGLRWARLTEFGWHNLMADISLKASNSWLYTGGSSCDFLPQTHQVSNKLGADFFYSQKFGLIVFECYFHCLSIAFLSLSNSQQPDVS